VRTAYFVVLFSGRIDLIEMIGARMCGRRSCCHTGQTTLLQPCTSHFDFAF